MKYFVELNNKIEGPFLLVELLKLELNYDSLVWYEELSDWVKVRDVKQIHDLLLKKDELNKTTPPPLPQKDKILKVEAVIKKDNTSNITSSSEKFIAKFIKKTFFSLLISCCLCGVAAAGYYSYYINDINTCISDMDYFNESLKEHLSDPANANESNVDLTMWAGMSGDYIEKRLNKLGCSDGLVLHVSYRDEDIEADISSAKICLEIKKKNVVETTYKILKTGIPVSFIALLVIQYIFMVTKWVNLKSNEV